MGAVLSFAATDAPWRNRWTDFDVTYSFGIGMTRRTTFSKGISLVKARKPSYAAIYVSRCALCTVCKKEEGLPRQSPWAGRALIEILNTNVRMLSNFVLGKKSLR